MKRLVPARHSTGMLCTEHHQQWVVSQAWSIEALGTSQGSQCEKCCKNIRTNKGFSPDHLNLPYELLPRVPHLEPRLRISGAKLHSPTCVIRTEGRICLFCFLSHIVQFTVYYHSIRQSVLCHLQYRKVHLRRGHEGAE